MKYKPEIVIAYFGQSGIAYVPYLEHKFHPTRKWRFDFAWPRQKVFIEVQGGIWIAGGHSRGAAMKKDWEKWNAATVLGWRGLWCEPKDLCTQAMVELIKKTLE